jgi:F420-non-reducing hydrogenase small subunit
VRLRGLYPRAGQPEPGGEIVHTAFNTVSTDNPHQIYPRISFDVPEGEIHIPKIFPTLRTLDQVVDVDYYMPGCPPESHQIGAVIDLVMQVLQGKAELPPKGATIGAGDSTVCDECQRERNVKTIKSFHRIYDVDIDPELCLLEQGVLCNGPATRSGCNARCVSAGAQCIGCYGPAEGVIDYGARLIAAFASVIDSNDPEEIEPSWTASPTQPGSSTGSTWQAHLLKAAKPAWEKA